MEPGDRNSITVQPKNGAIGVEVANPSVSVSSVSPSVMVYASSVDVQTTVASPTVSVGVARPQVVVDAPAVSVDVDVVGAPGPPGADGAAGPAGPPGPKGDPGADVHHYHRQAIPSQIWSITHNMGRRPNVSVQDDGGSVVQGSVRHISENALVLTFRYPITGSADCS